MKTLVFMAETVGASFRQAFRHQAAMNGLACETIVFDPREDVSARARKRLPEGWECVAAVGGDGTVAAVAHALVGGDVPLGIVPAGTGNLVARELGVPLAVEEAVALLAGRAARKCIDAMRIGGRTFLLNAGVGINAQVIDETSRLGKSLFGRSAYVGTAVWKVLKAKPQRIELEVDGQAAVYEATDVQVSNCGILARALNPNGPDVRADDGKLDVSVVCMKTPLEYPWYYFLKRIAPQRVNRIVHELEARRRVVVRSDRPLAVQADGDIIGVTPVEIEVLPNALSVLAPEEGGDS